MRVIRHRNRIQRTDWFDVLNVTLLTSLMLIVAVPFYGTVVKSFMSQQEYTFRGVSLWPERPVVQNYIQIFSSGIWQALFNSVVYTALYVALAMFLTTTLAYGLSKKGWPGRRLVQNLIVFTMYFSGGLVPFFLVVKQLGMMGTIWSVVVPTALSVYNMIIMRTFFEQLPSDLEEAALIDGAGPLTIFFRIELPLIKPCIATIVLFYAVHKWNEWYYPTLFLSDHKMWPIQVFLRQFLQADNMLDMAIDHDQPKFNEGIRAAATVVTILPIMCVYPFLQKYFVKGVMVGAIKS